MLIASESDVHSDEDATEDLHGMFQSLNRPAALSQSSDSALVSEQRLYETTAEEKQFDPGPSTKRSTAAVPRRASPSELPKVKRKRLDSSGTASMDRTIMTPTPVGETVTQTKEEKQKARGAAQVRPPSMSSIHRSPPQAAKAAEKASQKRLGELNKVTL